MGHVCYGRRYDVVLVHVLLGSDTVDPSSFDMICLNEPAFLEARP